MAYPEFLVAPMREELTSVGFTELRTAADVDRAVGEKGTTLMVVNSVCGCAAGKARPGIARAMQHAARPDHAVTVFAGADIEATDRARSYFTGYPPSSPSLGILRDGKLVYMMERHQIEGNSADGIAAALTAAFDKYCATQNA
jgi:putative YphP/YqiW family bacilliredoxin